jgi:hypothetical protein
VLWDQEVRALPHAEICWAKRCSSGWTLPIEDKLEEDIVVHRAIRAFWGETE